MLMEETERTTFLEELYREQFTKLFLYAKAALNNPDLAEEAVQDTFRIACDKLDQITDSKNPPGWLMNTLKYIICNMERSHSSLYSSWRNSIEYSDISSDGELDEYNIYVLYHGILTDEEFELLRCIVIERCSYLEASKRFEISIEACKKRIQHIKRKMREALQHEKD